MLVMKFLLCASKVSKLYGCTTRWTAVILPTSLSGELLLANGYEQHPNSIPMGWLCERKKSLVCGMKAEVR